MCFLCCEGKSSFGLSCDMLLLFLYIYKYIYILCLLIYYIYVCVYIYIYIYTTKMSRGKRVFFNVCFPDWLKVGGRNFYRNQSRFKFFYAELVLRLSETFFTKRWKKITYRISFFFQLTFFLEKLFYNFVWCKPKLISCLIDLFVFFKASGVVPSWYVSFSLVSFIHLEDIWFEIFSGEGNPNEIWIWKGKILAKWTKANKLFVNVILLVVLLGVCFLCNAEFVEWF